jgi:hypothetical protein
MPAGCRHTDRVPAYLINLQRLGLTCFSDQPLSDEIAYQVLEAQPHVLEAIKSASRAKSVQRTLRLTPFGEEFCAACFPKELDEVEELTGDPEALQERAAQEELWAEIGEHPDGDQADGDRPASSEHAASSEQAASSAHAASSEQATTSEPAASSD